jgi:hypothetical protein
MIAAKFDLNIDEGTDYSQAFTLSDPDTKAPIDLTGYTGQAQIRENYAAIRPIVTFRVVSGGTDGTITISCKPADTENLPFENPDGLRECPIEGVWDLFITDPSLNVTRLVRGVARIYPRVTQ